MRLKWSDRALQQFEDGIDYIARENPVGASNVAQRVADAMEMLLGEPGAGHQGRIKNTLEWVVLKTPYIIAYAVQEEELQILRLIPSKQSPARLLKQ